LKQTIYGLKIAIFGLTTLAICAWTPSPAYAKTIYFGTETETVTLIYGGATLFRFPGEVRTISQANRFEISPANPDQPNYALLSIRPRFTSGSSEVAFILSDGATIKTKLVVVSRSIPEKTDSIYEFKSKDSVLGNGNESKAGSGLSELELMKAMLRGDEVSGYEVRNLSRSISPGFKGVNTKLVRIYTGNQFNGYIFELSNTTKAQKLFINIQNLTLGDPNLAILSAVDNPVIEPEATGKNKTFLRIVAKPTSIYNELILPVQVAEKKEGT
jgi:hypothetical protein